MLFFAFSANSTIHSIVANNSNNFVPSTLTISLGDTVEFTNTGGFHNVNATLSTFPNNKALVMQFLLQIGHFNTYLPFRNI